VQAKMISRLLKVVAEQLRAARDAGDESEATTALFEGLEKRIRVLARERAKKEEAALAAQAAEPSAKANEPAATRGSSPPPQQKATRARCGEAPKSHKVAQAGLLVAGWPWATRPHRHDGMVPVCFGVLRGGGCGPWPIGPCCNGGPLVAGRPWTTGLCCHGRPFVAQFSGPRGRADLGTRCMFALARWLAEAAGHGRLWLLPDGLGPPGYTVMAGPWWLSARGPRGRTVLTTRCTLALACWLAEAVGHGRLWPVGSTVMAGRLWPGGLGPTGSIVLEGRLWPGGRGPPIRTVVLVRLRADCRPRMGGLVFAWGI
jgi:hypothetical protein